MLLLDQPDGVCRCLVPGMPALFEVLTVAPALAFVVGMAGEETLLAVLPGVSVNGETASRISWSSFDVDDRRMPAICTFGGLLSVRRRLVGRCGSVGSGPKDGEGPSGFWTARRPLVLAFRD